MIRLSNRYYVSHKNGYYLTHKVSIKGPESKQAGEESLKQKSYADMLTAWQALKDDGEDGSKALACMEQAKIEYNKTESNKFIAELEKSNAKKEASNAVTHKESVR